MRRSECYRAVSALEFIRLRQAMGLERYRKTRPRDPDKWRLLRRMYLMLMERREVEDYLLLGPRRRIIKT
jgi:hypothetical protein